MSYLLISYVIFHRKGRNCPSFSAQALYNRRSCIVIFIHFSMAMFYNFKQNSGGLRGGAACLILKANYSLGCVCLLPPKPMDAYALKTFT